MDRRTGQLKAVLKPAIGSVMTLAFSPDGRTLAGAGSNRTNIGDFIESGRVTLWDIPTGRILRTLEGPTGRANNVAFSPDGQTIAAGGLGPWRERWNNRVRLFTSEPVGEVRLWEVATGIPVWTAEGVSPVASLAFSADGKSLAYRDLANVYLSDARNGKLNQIVMGSIVRFRPHRSRNRAPGKSGGRDGAG